MNEWYDAEQHVERAHELYEAGRLEEAESELRQAIALNPFQAEWQFNLGLTLDAAGRHSDAAEAFRLAFELNPEDGTTAMMTGVSLLNAAEPKVALEWLEKASKLDPSNVTPLVHRIEAHTDLGQHDQAELMFYLSQQVNPRSAEAHLAIADSLLDRELYEKAVWCLREAAKLDPEMPGVQGKLAEAYAATGRHERARQLYLRELRTDPGNVDVLLDLGELLFDMNRFNEASEKFRRVLELEPDNADAYYELAMLAERQENDEEALAHLDVVLRLDNEYPGARRRLAAILLRRRGEDDQGLIRSLLRRELAQVRARPEDFVQDDLLELGRLLLDAGLLRDAAALLRRAVKADESDATALHLLSVSLLESGDRAAGMEAAKRVLRLDSNFIPAMHNLAMACARERQWRRARYWLREARRVDPDDASLRRLAVLLFVQAVGGWARRLVRLRRGS
jgi:tetratricopeptide (TPR) repeat protein